MKLSRNEKILSKISSLLMLVTLAWLTISTPFIYEHQQNLIHFQLSHLQSENNLHVDDSDSINTMLPNPSEERTETNSNNFSEYLHHHDYFADDFITGTNYPISLSSELYIAFHGELLSPPPDKLV